jgi:hypothetical protein
MGGSIGRDCWRLGLSLLLLAGLWLTLADSASALALSSFAWTGERAPNNIAWSSEGNWASDTAPSPSSTVESLDFPATASDTCTSFEGYCFFLSENDIGGLTTESMHIDDAQDYAIFGEPITLGAGGLSASPASPSEELTAAEVDVPIDLGASQTWHVTGEGLAADNQLYVGGGLAGSSEELAVDLADVGAIDLGEENEVGPVTFSGAEAGQSFANGLVGLFGATLNASDGNPVNLENVFFYGAGALGALNSSGSVVFVAVSSGARAEGTLKTTAAKLDDASSLDLEIARAGAIAGGDYSQLTSTGAIQLEGAKLGVYVEKRTNAGCPSLAFGQVYTLLSTTGGLSGAFGNAPQGSEIPVSFAKACGSMPPQFLRIAYNESGLTQTVTGTLTAGVASSTTLSASPLDPLTGQSVTLTATVAPEASYRSSLAPWGSVEFESNGAVIPGCAAQQVSGDEAVFTATCKASFAAAGAQSLTAVFTPEVSVDLLASTSASETLNVSQAPTPPPNPTPTPNPTGTTTGTATSTGTSTTTGTTASGSPGSQGGVLGIALSHGGVSLKGFGILVQSSGLASAKLACTAPAGCHGKLTLLVKSLTKAGGRKRGAVRALAIATAAFSLADGSTRTVKLQLDGVGRAMLRADRGHLPASLKILELTPAPAATQADSVQLAFQGKPHAKQ